MPDATAKFGYKSPSFVRKTRGMPADKVRKPWWARVAKQQSVPVLRVRVPKPWWGNGWSSRGKTC